MRNRTEDALRFVRWVGALVAVGLLSRHRLKLILLLAIAAPIVWVNLRPDLQNRYLTLIDPSYGPQGAQTSAEGRIRGWQYGVELWQRRPVFGVGPGAFGTAIGSGFSAHHLYGQVLGELGTCGAIGFAIVLCAFLANVLAFRRLCREQPECKQEFSARVIWSVTFTVVLLLLMGLGAHNLYRYNWMWFGAFQAIALHCLVRQRAAAIDYHQELALEMPEAAFG